MKVLNLVLYSNTTEYECYDIMYQLTQEFYKSFDNVRTIYYKYDNIEEEYILNGDVLSIRGKETFVPGVLDKTLKMLEYIINNNILDDYDVIVRSNISTIIDFNLLVKELETKGIPHYGGGKVENLQWKGGGINDTEWFGTLFVSGTAIIMSKEAVRCIIENKTKIKMDIIDDVSIAIFFRTQKNYYPPIELNHFANIPCFFKNTDNSTVFYVNELKHFIKKNNLIFYRNNCILNRVDRRLDIIQMRHIIDYLIYSHKIS